MTRTLSLTRAQVDQMIAHAQSQLPREACGLLAGKDLRVDQVLLVANRDPGNARFVMDPMEQLRAFESIESNGLDLLGIFHSHPNGPDSPSRTDVDEAAYDVVHVIVARVDADWRVRGFWIESGGVTAIQLAVV